MNGVRSDVYKRVWRLFKKHGVDLPFPQRDIHFHDDAQFRQLVTALARGLAQPESAPPEG